MLNEIFSYCCRFITICCHRWLLPISHVSYDGYIQIDIYTENFSDLRINILFRYEIIKNLNGHERYTKFFYFKKKYFLCYIHLHISLSMINWKLKYCDYSLKCFANSKPPWASYITVFFTHKESSSAKVLPVKVAMHCYLLFGYRSLGNRMSVMS